MVKKIITDIATDAILDAVEDRVEDILDLEAAEDKEVYDEYQDEVLGFLGKIPDFVNPFLIKYKKVIISAAVLIGGGAFGVFGIDVAHKFESIPLFGSLFELVGVYIVLKFAYKNFLKAEDRAVLLEKLSAIKDQVFGSEEVEKPVEK